MVIVLTLQLKSLEFEPPKKNQIRRKLNQKCLLMEKDDQNIFKSPDNLVGNTAQLIKQGYFYAKLYITQVPEVWETFQLNLEAFFLNIYIKVWK